MNSDVSETPASAQREAWSDLEPEGPDLIELLAPVVWHWRWVLVVPVVVAVAAFGMSHAIKPTYTAQTSFVIPTQSNGIASTALATLGALSGTTGAGVGPRSAGDQYIALLQSRWVADRLVDRFGLLAAYQVKYRFEAHAKLARLTRVTAGRRDGLISIAVDDISAERAAAIANRYVDELRVLTSELALTEAQQRRAFFDREILRAREGLTRAQRTLQASGFDERSLRAEPRTASEAYARLRAEVTAAEIRVAALRQTMADSAPEMQQQLASVEALRAQLKKLERSLTPTTDPNYIDRFREFKYQEELVAFLTRQQEAARLDESREGAFIQVVDAAVVPEWKSSPKRAFIATTSAGAAFVAVVIWLVMRERLRIARSDPGSSLNRIRRGRAGAA